MFIKVFHYWFSMEYKEKNKVICGICAGYIGKTDNPEGELGYDGCEEPTRYYDEGR